MKTQWQAGEWNFLLRILLPIHIEMEHLKKIFHICPSKRNVFHVHIINIVWLFISLRVFHRISFYWNNLSKYACVCVFVLFHYGFAHKKNMMVMVLCGEFSVSELRYFQFWKIENWDHLRRANSLSIKLSLLIYVT